MPGANGVMAEASAATAPGTPDSVLLQRLATAAIGLPLVFLLVVAGGWPYRIVVAVALAGAAFEGMRMFARSGRAEPALLTATPLAVLLLGATFVLLRDADNGRDWVLMALLGTFATDTGAYASGRAFGRRRMAPRISPNKTWEGFAGGWATGFGAIVLANYLLGLRVAPQHAITLGIALPLAAVGGDLAESWLKRRAGVKDSSNVLPGHGGLLDRLDSLLATIPVTWLYAVLFVL